jgi:iron complex transport system ATP-binding protein
LSRRSLGRLGTGAADAATVTTSVRHVSDVLRFLDVDVVRGGVPIVSQVSWDVAEGERWVVLGPNGAGKTTLLALAATLIHPTRGSVEVLDQVLGRTDVFELRPRIGLASSALAGRIPPAERVSDVVVTAAYAVTGRWREGYERGDHGRAAALLEQLGVGALADRTFGTLSEGERKRVQVARALMTDPELLLLDEPAAGLDLGGREDLVRRLGEIAGDEEAPTTVLVTHHVEEIPAGFTHAMLLRQGAVVAQGPISEVLTAEHLGAAFGIDLVVERLGDRWSARAV